MWSRENIPLLIMSVVSAAILCFFALSSSAMFSVPRQLDDCGWSKQAGRLPGRIGCARLSTAMQL
jgi:hypothetical protein